MKYWTYAEIKGKVFRDLEMEGETFVSDIELLGYANEAIDEVERQIHMLCEDYFVTRTTIGLVSGQEAYDLPSDIYGLKIRQITYKNGTDVWRLHRLKNWRKFDNYEIEQVNSTGTRQYGYFILNSVPGQPKIILAPTPAETGQYLHLWYIRNANTLVDDTSICDIPEAANYVIAYIKMRCMEKELHPNLQKAVADVDRERADTIAVLSEMYADNETEIEPDFRLYNDMTGGR